MTAETTPKSTISELKINGETKQKKCCIFPFWALMATEMESLGWENKRERVAEAVFGR